MKRSANYATDFHCEPLKPREFKLKNNIDTTYSEVTPLFEKKLLEESRKKHYSLVNNENLYCLWRQKIDREGMKCDVNNKRQRQLPDTIRDYHFHNQVGKFIPTQSLRNRPPAHFVLSPGPGVDKYGDKLIPSDMIMKRYQYDNKTDKSSAILKKRRRKRL